jgi:hypothetical protein
MFLESGRIISDDILKVKLQNMMEITKDLYLQSLNDIKQRRESLGIILRAISNPSGIESFVLNNFL